MQTNNQQVRKKHFWKDIDNIKNHKIFLNGLVT